jgi:hypothetical protein
VGEKRYRHGEFCPPEAPSRDSSDDSSCECVLAATPQYRDRFTVAVGSFGLRELHKMQAGQPPIEASHAIF